MASQPRVTAIIEAEDHASAAIAKLVGNARAASGEMSTLGARGASEAMAAAKAHSAALDAQRQQLAAYRSDALAAFGAVAAHGVHSMMEVGGEMERVQRRMASFTNASKEQLAAIRQQADTMGAGLKGGPEGFFDAARAASMSSVKPEHAGIVAKYGSIFADETGEANDVATEKLVQHVSMLQHLRDDAGNSISFAEANAEQVERAMRETMNLLIAINKIAPGNIGQVFEGFKFAGPTTLGLGRDANETAALYTVLAEHGIVGSEAGNTIKSSLARLLSPTAKARQAIATGGLNYGDYIHANPDVVSAEGIEKGVSLRLGTLNESTKAGIKAAVDKFKTGPHDLDAFNRELTDIFVASGAKGMNDRLKAGNVARDTIANFASTADLPAFLRDAHNKGLGVGFLDAIFGQQQGGRLAAVSGQEVLDKRKLYEEETAKDNVGEAMRERAASYDGMRDRFLGSLKGLEDQLFEAGIKGPAMAGYQAGGDVLQGLASTPERFKAWLAEMTAAASVIGGSAAASSLTRIAGALTGLGVPTEGAVGGLLRLAGIIGRFSTLGTVGGILGGVQLGNALGEGALQLGAIAAGKYWMPSSPEDAADLSAERESLRAEIAKRKAATFDPNAHDPELKRLQDELAAARTRLATMGTPGDDNPEIRRRVAEIDRLRAAPPAVDPEVPRLQARLAELDARTGAQPSPKESLLRGILERRESRDPKDPGLPALRAQLDRIQADRQRERVDLGGEADTLKADIARRQAASLAEAKDTLAAKQFELSDYRAKLVMSPNGIRQDVADLQAKVDARKAENARLNIFEDPTVRELQDRVATLDNRLAAFNRVNHPNPFLTAQEPEMHQGPAMPVTVSTAPAGNPFLNAATTSGGAPTMRLDQDLAALAQALGGLGGGNLGAEIRGALTNMPPAKVDVPPLTGTVTGQAEIAASIAVQVNPSPLLTAIVDHAHDIMAHVNLDGKMGEDMTGTNGAKPSRPIMVGIGHM